jgi:hypothetical protein
MLENKTSSPTVVESTNIVFDSGWKRVSGRGINLPTNLYSNNTERMLMWSFEMISIRNSPTWAMFHPQLLDLSASLIAVDTDYAWTANKGPSFSTIGADWWVLDSASAAIGKYRFSSTTGNGKWNMLPAGFSVRIYSDSSFQSNHVVDYKLTVVEADTSLLVNRN